MSSDVFYPIHCVPSHSQMIDHPDQRIAEDINKLASTLMNLCEELMLAPLLILYYAWDTAQLMGWLSPFYVFIFFLGGTFVIRFFLSPVVRKVSELECLEGEFRYCIRSINKHSLTYAKAGLSAEEIEFFKARQFESEKLTNVLERLLRKSRDLLCSESLLLGIFQMSLIDRIE